MAEASENIEYSPRIENIEYSRLFSNGKLIEAVLNGIQYQILKKIVPAGGKNICTGRAYKDKSKLRTLLVPRTV